MGKADRGQARLAEVRSFVGGVYGEDLHAKRIASLAGATLGVMQAASLAVAMIGQALAQARGLVTKHAIKQVDRLLSNHGIDVWESFARWVPHPSCCIGRWFGRTGPVSRLGSCDPDVLRTSELEHVVKHVGGDGHFGRLPSISARA